MMFNYYLINIKGLNIDSTLIKIYNNNIKISNLKRISHEELEFQIAKADYVKIEKYLSSFQRNIREQGINRLKKYLLTHVAVLIAIPIIIYLCYFASLFVWNIEVTGLEEIEASSVIRILNENGVKEGKLKELRVTEIEKLLLDSSMFAQVSCYYRGTSLMINVSEKLVYEVIEFEPIKAKFSGIITDYTLEQGTINFVIGEYVNVGDILVHPYMIDKDGNKVIVEPKANIEAKVYFSATVTKHKNEVALVPTGKTCTRYILSYKTPKKSFTKLNNPFVFFEVKVYNKYISNVLPFIRQKVVFTELIKQTKVNDLISIQSKIEEDSRVLAYDKVVKENVINETTSSVIVNDILYATTTLTFIGSII